jgi:hypothetical protein
MYVGVRMLTYVCKYVCIYVCIVACIYECMMVMIILKIMMTMTMMNDDDYDHGCSVNNSVIHIHERQNKKGTKKNDTTKTTLTTSYLVVINKLRNNKIIQ